MTSPDHYRTLGLSHTVTLDEIKIRYRQLAKEYHPDRNSGSKVAEERFRAVTQAYEVLSDPEKRAQYNKYIFTENKVEKYAADPKKNKDLETIIQAITAVKESLLTYEGFFNAYRTKQRINFAKIKIQAYIKTSTHTKEETEKMSRLLERTKRELEELVHLAESNNLTQDQLNNLLHSYQTAEQIAQRHSINLQELVTAIW
ncbi:MAG: DnaJ domain-containing protein [Nanoarchaeota archaeon]